MLTTKRERCPYCGEAIELAIDASVEHQRYIEDCWVCCRPIEVEVSIGLDSEIYVSCRAENDT